VCRPSLISRRQILIDRDLLRFDDVWAAAGTLNSVFRITPSDLVRVTGGSVADLHEEPSRHSGLFIGRAALILPRENRSAPVQRAY
jgi:hypothetical protein